MSKDLYRIILLVLICAVTVSASRRSLPLRGDNATASSDWSALGASMDKMHLAMASVESSGDADVDFVKLMLPHHQAAIDMAKTQLTSGTDPQMRRLAQEIITRSAVGD